MTAPLLPAYSDVAIVGAGAAGLATAIFTRRLAPDLSVVLLDGVKKPGAKILISGGGRCNVTNVSVSGRDFWGGQPPFIHRVLRALSIPDTVAFFRAIGVNLREEADGKLFPETNRARDVIDALLREAAAAGVLLLPNHRVLDILREHDGFNLRTSQGSLQARATVLATGGQSLPKTGSDGAGYELARRLGHTVVTTTPGLVPLVLSDDDTMHTELSGVAQEAELTVWIDQRAAVRLSGALLWTHFGVSGPVALNASRHWLQAERSGQPVVLTANFCPGLLFEEVDRRWTALTVERPKTSVRNTLATMLPASLADALLTRLRLNPTTALAHFGRDERRRLVHAVVEWRLPVIGTRGYNYAEVTAGGVSLAEINPATLESRVCPRLFLVGEVLDVDGRIGGFNFQWAWSSGKVAAVGLALADAAEKSRRAAP